MLAQLLSSSNNNNNSNSPVRQLASQVCGLFDVVVVIDVAPVAAACCMSRLACNLGKCLLSVA